MLLVPKPKYSYPGLGGNQKPHLVLNFDVNNTVVMLDSATGADSKGLIARLGREFFSDFFSILISGY